MVTLYNKAENSLFFLSLCTDVPPPGGRLCTG